MTHAPLDPDLRAHALAARGFMPPDEGDALHAAALEARAAVPGAPFAEVGSYCGRSTIWLGPRPAPAARCSWRSTTTGARRRTRPAGTTTSPTWSTPALGRMDTLPIFRRTVFDAGLEDHVVAAVGQSPAVARIWSTPLALCFIDGGHGREPARLDYEGWAGLVAPGGTLAIHDVFPDPADGGRPPYEEIYLPALESGRFTERSATGSLRVLTRTG